MRLGVLPLGRSTFDVEYAGRKLVAALRGLDATGHEVFGSRMLLLDEDATLRAIGDLAASRVDQVLILQLTFTDARMTVAAAAAFEQPLSIWAMPEPRLGGRLRLNALCGLNLVRIASLFWTGSAYPDYLGLAHLLVWQPAMIVAAVLLWLLWSRAAARAGNA